MGSYRRKLAALAAAAALASVAPTLGGLTAAHADGPGSGTPWVVSVGDSYISGEAGRWAGNTNGSSTTIDALGGTAYFDNAAGTGETIARCHRSRSAEVFVGAGANSLNLACSGAITVTRFDSDGNFKPGLDFYVDAYGRKGQARMLQEFAGTHNVKMIPLSIGGNNFHFADVAQTCLSDFLSSPSWWQNQCSSDPAVTANFSADSAAARTNEIANAIANIRQAMANVGYADSAYTILVQDYESPVPPGAQYRYSESGYTRQSTGGCGFWNADVDWMNFTAMPTINGAVRNAVNQLNLPNVKFMEVSSAFNGHRLCENTVGLLEEKGLASWQSPGAADQTEWVNQIRTVSTIGSSPYVIQEGFHPSYWGQLALRNCLRQAWNGGSPQAGRCTGGGGGQNGLGEPTMAFARQVVVPSVVGLTYTQASAQVSAAGLTPVKNIVYTCDYDTSDQVIAQSPGGGAKAYAGDRVSLSVYVTRITKVCGY